MAKSILRYSLLFFLTGVHLPAAEIDLADPPESWAVLMEGLKAPQSLRTGFEEYRSNPFHRLKRRFDGMIRWQHDLGLSLHYVNPRDVRIIVRPAEILIVKDESVEVVSSLANEEGVLQLIPRLFSWDTLWLSENFEVDGDWRSATDWEMTLSPREGNALGQMLNRITIEGSENIISRIRMDARGGREIEINLLNQEIDPEFSGEELTSAFLISDE